MYEVFKRDKLRLAHNGPFNTTAKGELGGSAGVSRNATSFPDVPV
ncbi:hypothetical protein SLU01_11490 [Sporosarcina luteola]|uniref:Uncharacterized protein n=1 Tax=Sporosarcina luteola TaxID=582850 RepID=A0A511Z5W1_9BACL|nr:hypothetical protein SLU01_11490 [Sporosarcina luteola]